MKSILCIGSVYVDINCLSFPVEDGLKPEIEIVGNEYEVVPGGSAVNFARFINKLGFSSILAGQVGLDDFGHILRQLLMREGVKHFLKKNAEVTTDLGVNFVSETGATVMAVVGTANKSLSEADLSDFVREYSDRVTHVYLGGCLKFPWLLSHLIELTRSLKDKGIVVTLDHGRVPSDISAKTREEMRRLAKAVNIYMPSRDEFLALWSSDDIKEAVNVFHADNSISSSHIVAIKDGASGAIAFSGGQRVLVKAYPVEPKNTVGAGDSFNAGFIAAQTLNFDLRECLEFACATAAIKISNSKIPTINDVDHFRRDARGIGA